MKPIGYPDRKKREILLPESRKISITNLQLFAIINEIWQRISMAFVQSHEPKIWQSSDRWGQTWWYAYDPSRDCLVCRDCEDEIRIWLEERYYR